MVVWFVVLCMCLLFSLSSAKHIKYSEKEDVEIEIDIINSSQNYWIAAPNYITRKGSKYFKRLLGGKISSDRLPEKKIFNENLTNGVPASFDARSKWSNCPSIGSVTNQGHCGSCWAIATTSVMSDRICISTNGKVQVSISAQNLLSCCGECVSPHTHGCDGGYADQAYKHFQSVGLVTGGYHSNEGCQPYEIGSFNSHNNLSQITNVVTPPCSKKCTNKSYKTPYSKDKHKGKSSYSLPQDVTRIQTEIMEYGPVTATFDVYSDLKTYHSGVYVKTSSKKVETHTVKVIGWGTENNVNYWLVINSWGKSWGLNGLFKIRRGTNECGFESRVSAGLTNT